MKPLSSHWADIMAMKIVNERPKNSGPYVVASGITPSGKIHVGNFREVITVDLVARALRALGKEVRFIYSWDNFDTFRKVPQNLPQPEAFTPYLRQAVARIPDPWGEAQSYAAGRIAIFEKELEAVGIDPEFIYQEKAYSAGTYAENIHKILENLPKVREILNQHRTSPLPDSWLPTSIYCGNCHKDEMHSESYLGDYQYAYHCKSCDHQDTVDIRRSRDLKLLWRLDWPMRWFHEKVDFEPGGKDHSSQGGSFDTGKELVRELFDFSAPMYLQYDFVAIKGGAGKMSSSSGNLFTLSEVLAVYDPQIVRWIFAGHRPNHDFSLAFDEDVFKIYDEFDRAEAAALGPEPSSKKGKWAGTRRVYELSAVDGQLPEVTPVRAGFRELCNRLQICQLDTERTFQRFYGATIETDADKERFFARAACAKRWLDQHAPEEFCYTIPDEPRHMPELTAAERQVLASLAGMVEEHDLAALAPKEINELIWDHVIRPSELESAAVFSVIYRKLIGREQGPRLPAFLKEIEASHLRRILQ